jgi:hypothetical protein
VAVGVSVDASVSVAVGVSVDATVGVAVGVSVDATVGATVGASVGATVGTASAGWKVGPDPRAGHGRGRLPSPVSPPAKLSVLGCHNTVLKTR